MFISLCIMHFRRCQLKKIIVIVDDHSLQQFLCQGVFLMLLLSCCLAAAHKLLRSKRTKCFFISVDLKIKFGRGVHRPKERIGLEDKNGKTLPSDYLEKQ